MDRGWVKFYRKMVDWEWYREPNTAHLFFHLVLMANRKDGKWRGITVPRGSLVTTFRGLAEQTGMSVRNVRTALNHLISTHDVTQQSTKEYTLLKVENYDLYQSGDTESDTQVTHKRHTTDTQPTRNKKERSKEVKKERREGTANISEIITSFTADPELSRSLSAFFSVLGKEKALTDQIVQSHLNDLRALANGDIGLMRHIAGESVAKGWKGFYKSSLERYHGSKPKTAGQLPDWYSDKGDQTPATPEQQEQVREMCRKLREGKEKPEPDPIPSLDDLPF